VVQGGVGVIHCGYVALSAERRSER